MSAIDVTSATIGNGLVPANTLNAGDTFVFNDADINAHVFFIKALNAGDYLNPFAGTVAAFGDVQQLVRSVTVTAQIQG